MNELFEVEPDLEQLNPISDASDGVMLPRISQDLNEEESGWLENLIGRMTDPVRDTLDINEGYDTERITPGDAGSEGISPVVDHDLAGATQEWHFQQSEMSCAVCAQQFIINEFLDQEVSEAELAATAELNGWYDPETGTGPYDSDNLLEMYGIDTRINEQGTVMDIKETLDQGGRVIAGVDSTVLWVDGVGNYPLTGADHVVEVIGIDESDPDNVKIIVNDPGVHDGCGKAIPLADFEEAWSVSGCFMISAMRND